jgi:chromate transporter
VHGQECLRQRDNSDMPSSESTSVTAAHSEPLARPQSCTDLFWSFTLLALQGFGGVLAVAQREMVDKKQWLTRDQFIEDWAVAQVLPGPNIVNFALMLGDRHFGLRGAMASLSGMLLFPLVLLLAVVAAFSGMADSPAVQGSLRGMGAVAAGLIAATGLKLIAALKTNVMGAPVCIALAAITFVAIGVFRIPLIWVLLVLGGVACLWAHRQLGQIAASR